MAKRLKMSPKELAKAERVENAYLAKIKSIPPLTDKEQKELLFRWRMFEDYEARDRVVEANLRLVLPIAKSVTRRFKFYDFRTAMFELIGAGSLALVRAVDGFHPERGKLEHYARRSIRNECVNAAKALLSVVDRPYYTSTRQDILIDPKLPDMISPQDYCGTRARTSEQLNSWSRRLPGSVHGKLRPWPKEPAIRFKKQANEVGSKIMDLRNAGFTLQQTANELGMSLTTVWRRQQAYIETLI